AGASDSQTEEAFGQRVDFVISLVGPRLDIDDVVTGKPGSDSKESQRRKHFRAILLRHEIGGDLRLHELVVRHVFIERLDHPIAITPGIGIPVAGHTVSKEYR